MRVYTGGNYISANFLGYFGIFGTIGTVYNVIDVSTHKQKGGAKNGRLLPGEGETVQGGGGSRRSTGEAELGLQLLL